MAAKSTGLSLAAQPPDLAYDVSLQALWVSVMIRQFSCQENSDPEKSNASRLAYPARRVKQNSDLWEKVRKPPMHAPDEQSID
jgi:hypothetical protein